MSQNIQSKNETFFAEVASSSQKSLNQEEFDKKFLYSQPYDSNIHGLKLIKKFLKHYYKPFISFNNFLNVIYNFIPILQWLPKYEWKKNFFYDVIGGFTVGIMHVPQGIAYALLAKVPPIVGLYTSFFPSLIYMFFGTSKHNSIGSFAIISLMTGTTIVKLQNRYFNSNYKNESLIINNENTAIIISSTLTFCIGLTQIIMAILRLEIITTYFSDQVVAGFTTAASCHVFVEQLYNFLGLKNLPRRMGAGNLFMKLYDIVTNLKKINFITFCFSIITLVLLILAKDVLNPLLKKLGIKIPISFELIVVVLCTTISKIFNLNENYNVEIVNKIPTGIPVPSVPQFSFFFDLLSQAISMSFVIVAVHISLAKMFAKKLSYKVDPGQEFYALGFSSLISSFFPVYPVSCSLGRTIVNVESGTKTQLSTIFSCILLGSVIVYFGQYLKTLPMSTLSVLIIVALKGMVKKFADLKILWPISKIDFCIWLVSFSATVGWNVSEGLIISIVFALMTTVFRTQWPQWHFLVNLTGTDEFRDAKRYRYVTFHTDIYIFRFDSPLLFTNFEQFKLSIYKALKKCQSEINNISTNQDFSNFSFNNNYNLQEKNDSKNLSFTCITQENDLKTETLNENLSNTTDNEKKINTKNCRLLTFKNYNNKNYRHFIIDCSGFTFVDYMGVNALKEVFTELQNKNVIVYFAAAKAPVRDMFENCGFYKDVPKCNFYPTIRDAVALAKERLN